MFRQLTVKSTANDDLVDTKSQYVLNQRIQKILSLMVKRYT